MFEPLFHVLYQFYVGASVAAAIGVPVGMVFIRKENREAALYLLALGIYVWVTTIGIKFCLLAQ